MENNLNIHELEAVLEAGRKAEFQRQKFAAALKGVDLDEPKAGGDDVPSFEDIQNRAAAKLSGKSTEEIEFETLGFVVEEE